MEVYVFDMDGTLTPPRLPMTTDFASRFLLWQKDHLSYIATGSDIEKLREQLPKNVIEAFTGLYCSMGNILFVNGEEVYRKDFAMPESLRERLEIYRKVTKYPGTKYPNYIENRIGMTNFSVLGRNCPYSAREEYGVWDKKFSERAQIRDALARDYPDLEFALGGAISIDITPKGCGKGQIAHHLRKTYPEAKIVFMGDRTMEGGNDYELANELMTYANTAVCQVSGPAEVRTILGI